VTSRREVPRSRAVMWWLAGTSVLRHLERLGWNPVRHPDRASGRMGEMSEIDGMGTERATCVLARNPSAMTLQGTNTWIIGEPGAEEVVVVDPGPKDGKHLHRVVDTVASQGRRVGLVLLTHGHPDHSAGATKFAGLAGERVKVRAFDPEGKLSDYMGSLDRLRAFSAKVGAATILPGHGPKLDDPLAALDYYIDHRRERLAQVEAAVAAGARTAREVVERVYIDVDKSLWPAAEWSVQSQLDYLRSRA